MAVHQEIYKKLQEVARKQELITYSEIARLASLNMESQAERNRIGEILGEISMFEYDQGRPLLSAIVVHADDLTPGRGFFHLARQLGLLGGHDDRSETTFFVNEVKKVYRYWGNR